VSAAAAAAAALTVDEAAVARMHAARAAGVRRVLTENTLDDGGAGCLASHAVDDDAPEVVVVHPTPRLDPYLTLTLTLTRVGLEPKL